jgi:hypothetical protein
MFINILKDCGPRNIKDLIPHDAASHPGRPESSAKNFKSHNDNIP